MLELKEIYKTFNRGTITEKKAINGVDLKLNEGDFVTVKWSGKIYSFKFNSGSL